ncbi:MAG: hypothetical protein J6B71_02260 [Clostridia bacterium]|nr:hypothetical protein [Clostridia bacterium]
MSHKSHRIVLTVLRLATAIAFSLYTFYAVYVLIEDGWTKCQKIKLVNNIQTGLSGYTFVFDRITPEAILLFSAALLTIVAFLFVLLRTVQKQNKKIYFLSLPLIAGAAIAFLLMHTEISEMFVIRYVFHYHVENHALPARTVLYLVKYGLTAIVAILEGCYLWAFLYVNKKQKAAILTPN